MQDELDDHQEDCCSLTHEDWCDLLSTIKVKYNSKGQQPRARRYSLIERPLYLKAIDPCQVRRRQDLGMVSFAPTNNPTTRRLSTTVPSVIAQFARRQECLIGSIC